MSTIYHTQPPVLTQEDPMPTALETLRDIAENMSEEDQPWSHPAEKFRKALRCVEDAKVTPAPDDPGLFEVLSSEGTQTYLAADGTCTCPGSGKGTKAPWRCYHASAAELYRRWQLALDPAWDPWPATAGQPVPSAISTHEKAPQGDPGTSTLTPQEDRAVAGPLEGSRGHASASALPSIAPPVDLRPVPMPGGGERTTTVGQLMGAMARAQARMVMPTKDALNPHLGRRFLSLVAIRDVAVPALAAEGISVTQWYSRADGELLCWTMLAHASGEYQILPAPVPAPPQESGRTAIQTRGSTMSYARRYGLQAATGVVGEDEDDGAAPTALPGGSPRGSAEKAPVPTMTPPTTAEDSARDYLPRLEAAILASGGDLETWFKRGEEKFKGMPRSKWGAPQYEYMCRWVRAVQQGKQVVTADETA